MLWPTPAAQRGKIAIITRLGAGAVRGTLPAIIRAVQGARLGAPVVWMCDPMHGNTRVTSTGIKTRDFDDILAGERGGGGGGVAEPRAVEPCRPSGPKILCTAHNSPFPPSLLLLAC